jgi:hypothetical protein
MHDHASGRNAASIVLGIYRQIAHSQEQLVEKVALVLWKTAFNIKRLDLIEMLIEYGNDEVDTANGEICLSPPPSTISKTSIPLLS